MATRFTTASALLTCCTCSPAHGGQALLSEATAALGRDGNRTAVLLDTRSPEAFGMGSLSDARNVPLAEVAKAKDDGRLPMEDHNTRIVVFGSDAAQARAVTAELAKNAFHNVAYFSGSLDDLVAGLAEPLLATTPDR